MLGGLKLKGTELIVESIKVEEAITFEATNEDQVDRGLGVQVQVGVGSGVEKDV